MHIPVWEIYRGIFRTIGIHRVLGVGCYMGATYRILRVGDYLENLSSVSTGHDSRYRRNLASVGTRHEDRY